MECPQQSVLRLIEVMSHNPQLYDQHHPDYSQKACQDESWAKVANYVGRSLEYCQQTWCELLHRFKKELQARDWYMTTGCCFFTNWPYFESMLYMEHMLDSNNCSLSNATECVKENFNGVQANCCCQSTYDACHSRNPYLCKCTNKDKPPDSLQRENQNCACNASCLEQSECHNCDRETESLSDTENFQTKEISCDHLFARLIICMLKDIPNEELRDEVKLHIMESLIKAKHEAFEPCNEENNATNLE